MRAVLVNLQYDEVAQGRQYSNAAAGKKQSPVAGTLLGAKAMGSWPRPHRRSQVFQRRDS